jgi:hypothetical protein
MHVNLRTATARLLGATLLSLTGLGAGAAQDEPASRYEAARHAYERNHWQQAWDGFASLADEGHVGAARRVLEMTAYGPRLYGRRFVVDEGRSTAWARTVVDAVPAEREQLLADARQAFREHRFAAAYGRFVALADAGHAPSAQVALLMWRNGPTLFGSDWEATLPQQRRWAALTAQGDIQFAAAQGRR